MKIGISDKDIKSLNKTLEKAKSVIDKNEKLLKDEARKEKKKKKPAKKSRAKRAALAQIVAVLALGLLSACGSGDGVTGACAASSVKGTWYESDTDDTMVLNSDCSGTSSACGSTFTYPNVTGESGSVLINVTAVSGVNGCLPLGETVCSYAVSDSILAFTCGNSVFTYDKQ